MDNTEEIISLQSKVSRPPEYVRMTPILFNYWMKWVDQYNFERNEVEYSYSKSSGGAIMPMGTKIGPPWMKTKFEGLEEFYLYYIELLGVKNG